MSNYYVISIIFNLVLAFYLKSLLIKVSALLQVFAAEV